MRKQIVYTTLRIQTRHEAGQLATVAATIARHGGVIGDIFTVRLGERDTIRDVTIETADEAVAAEVVAALGETPGVRVVDVRDPVLEAHRGGKIRMVSTQEIKTEQTLGMIYTPGVARIVRALAERPALAPEVTWLSHAVGIFTNGTRVLGLGNVGTLASLPVMEGKAALYDAFAGLSAVPILVDTTDPQEFIDTVVRISGSFGAIHLEDIRGPDCFFIEDELKRRIKRPVMHDDQHGTATAALAGILQACVHKKQRLADVTLGQIGLGAAGSAIALLALAHGAGRVLVSDLDPASVARVTARGAQAASLEEVMKNSDIVVAATGRPGLIRPDMIRPGQIIFSLSNPDAEISPREALEAGAALAYDGRSINNALAYPGLFKGALSVQSREISQNMMLAAAETIASLAAPGEVVPSPLDLQVHVAVAKAVAECAIRDGLAGTAVWHA